MSDNIVAIVPGLTASWSTRRARVKAMPEVPVLTLSGMALGAPGAHVVHLEMDGADAIRRLMGACQDALAQTEKSEGSG